MTVTVVMPMDRWGIMTGAYIINSLNLNQLIVNYHERDLDFVPQKSSLANNTPHKNEEADNLPYSMGHKHHRGISTTP